jgi:hypothetical protein
MGGEQRHNKNKGGRPKKEIRRDQQLGVMCTLIERKIIEHKAKQANCCLSEYLRELALRGQVDRKIKVIPKEILQLSATLNHIAANLNQIAKKRNREEDLNAIERAELNSLSNGLKTIAVQIKTHYQ